MTPVFAGTRRATLSPASAPATSASMSFHRSTLLSLGRAAAGNSPTPISCDSCSGNERSGHSKCFDPLWVKPDVASADWFPNFGREIYFAARATLREPARRIPPGQRRWFRSRLAQSRCSRGRWGWLAGSRQWPIPGCLWAAHRLR